MASGSKVSLPNNSLDNAYEEDFSDQWQEGAALLAPETEDPHLPVSYSGTRTRVLCIRTIALLCACSLSIGSH